MHLLPLQSHINKTLSRVYTLNEVGILVMLHEPSNEACDCGSKYGREQYEKKHMGVQ